MKSEVGSIQDQAQAFFLHNLSLYSTSRSLHLELKAPTELWDRISGSSNMAQRKWPSYAEWLVERSVYSLFCGEDFEPLSLWESWTEGEAMGGQQNDAQPWNTDEQRQGSIILLFRCTANQARRSLEWPGRQRHEAGHIHHLHQYMYSHHVSEGDFEGISLWDSVSLFL